VILTKYIKIKIKNSNYKYYQSIGLNIKIGDEVEIPVDSLPISSNYRVEVSCDICNNVKDSSYNEYNRYIKKSTDGLYRCRICIKEISKRTKLEKYGDENYTNREKYKKTNLERYGGHFNKCTEFKDKIKRTNLEKYGSEYPIRNSDIREKRKNSIKEKYGYDEVFSIPDIRGKIKKTMIDKYGFEYSMQSESISDKIISKSKETKIKNIKSKNNIIEIDYSENFYKSFCSACNSEFTIKPHIYNLRKKYNTILCSNCNKIDHGSGLEMKLLDIVVENYKGEILLNSRTIIKPYELDIYLPELKIAFELNGIYWHSSLFKDKDYHLKKTTMCEESGIHLFQIWDDDFINKREIISSMIKYKLNSCSNKIHARKCSIKPVSKNEEQKFLNENHLQGYAPSSIKLGLYHNDELVSIMTFCKPRGIYKGNKEFDYELLRFCNKLDTIVNGSASKLFKYFIDKFRGVKILSYADRSHSVGDLYEKIGFKKIANTSPNYQYVINGRRVHRFSLRKDVLLKMGFDQTETEEKITKDAGIYRIYNSGNIKFIYE